MKLADYEIELKNDAKGQSSLPDVILGQAIMIASQVILCYALTLFKVYERPYPLTRFSRLFYVQYWEVLRRYRPRCL